MAPTWEEVQASQGTRLSDKNPWDTYGQELMNDPDMTETLKQQVEEYSKNYHDSSSSQNQEELARWQELNANGAKEYQFVEPDEYNDVKERTGRVMHSSEFIRRLQRSGIHCWYTEHPQAGKITLVVQRKNQPPEVACWCQQGMTTELSIMRFDEHGIPTTEQFRGWRTPLLQIILKGILTEDKANEFFGTPKTTPSFNRYNQTLQSFRNNGNQLDPQ